LPLCTTRSVTQKKWHNWKGAWKKALSDFWSFAILSFQITLHLLEKIRENLTLQKDSLRTLFHAPLQLWLYLLKVYHRIFQTIIMNSWELDHQKHKIGVTFFSLKGNRQPFFLKTERVLCIDLIQYHIQGIPFSSVGGYSILV